MDFQATPKEAKRSASGSNSGEAVVEETPVKVFEKCFQNPVHFGTCFLRTLGLVAGGESSRVGPKARDHVP